MYSTVDSKNFIQIKSQLPVELMVFLSDYSADEYRQMGAVCYISDDARSGYAIKPDGDLISVFSLPGAHQGMAAVKSAIQNGAKKLDCIGDFLVNLYGKFGFMEYDRMVWDDEYAPENWDYDRFGTPDIVFMRLP